MTARATIAAVIAIAAVPSHAIAGTCSITSVSPVAFGSYDVFAPSAVDSTGSITFDCSDVGTVRIALDRGAAASFAPRTLVAGPFALAYNLYLDAARTTVWGDGTGGTATYGPLDPADGPTTITIYGRVPANQGVGAGSYSDTIVVTLEF